MTQVSRLGKRDLWVPLLLLAGAYLLYVHTFGNGWTYDDFPVIVDNPDVRSIGAFLRDSYPGRPLRELTYLLDHALFGLRPAGWHLQNIFWHGLNAGLVWLLVLRLGGRRLVAGTAALLFLVHPLQVEVVANISHRKDSLLLAFALLSVLAWSRGFAGGRRRWGWLGGAVLLALVALTAKQSAVVLPLVFAAYEWGWVPREERLLLRYPLLAGVLLAGGLAGGFWYLAAHGEHYAEAMAGLLQLKANYFQAVTPGAYLRMLLKSWAYMFGKFPWPASLALEYTYPVPASWLSPWLLAALAGIVGYLVALWFSARRSPLVFFALVWTGAFWLPVSNLWPLTYFAADRYLYAPSVGVFVLLALGLERLLRGTTLLPWFAGALAIPLVLLTWQQETVWKSPETLWTHALEVSPESSFALNNLGNIALEAGNLLRARDFYQRAATVNPLNPTSHYNLGLIYERIGMPALALQHYRTFLEVAGPPFKEAVAALKARLRSEYGITLE